MAITVADAARLLEERGSLRRARKDQSDWVIDFVSRLIGRPIPADLAEFYRERIERIGDFGTTIPVWNDRVGRVTEDAFIETLLPARAIPIFDDGCGSFFGVDISRATDHPAVYFFDHESEFKYPAYAAGSSIATFLLLLAEHDTALHEKRPQAWELNIDPDLARCPRAPPIWLAD
jgi:hypothetical protein